MGAIVLFFVVPLLFLYFQRQRRRLPPLPPGPKKLPILGNMLQLPKWDQWETYDRWCKEIGSGIIHLSVVGTNIVILNTEEAVSDLLLKRSSIYSSRPHSTMLGDLIGWARSVIFMPYGDQWRSHRRVFHEEFSSSTVSRFEDQQVKVIRDFLLRVLNSPDEIMEHVDRMTADFIVSIAYGVDAGPYMATLKDSVEGARVAAAPGRFLVDSIPILKYIPDWVPGADFKRQAKQWRASFEDMCETPFAATKQLIVVHPDPFSFRPERFMRDGRLDPDIKDPLDVVFGIGRRVCPGRHLANLFLWNMIASILTVFDITKAVDKDGGVIEPPPHEPTEAFSIHSRPFNCSIKPRNKEAETLIRCSVEDAD